MNQEPNSVPSVGRLRRAFWALLIIACIAFAAGLTFSVIDMMGPWASGT